MRPRTWALLAIVAVVWALIWLLPALQGYHLGCNALIDRERVIRLGLQWCR